jgi:hypothetical protein
MIVGFFDRRGRWARAPRRRDFDVVGASSGDEHRTDDRGSVARATISARHRPTPWWDIDVAVEPKVGLPRAVADAVDALSRTGPIVDIVSGHPYISPNFAPREGK